MAVKYRVLYRDHHNQLCRVDISHTAYIAEPIILRGVVDAACIITRDCSDDPYEPIINTKAAINVWQDIDYPVNILELQQAQDREFIVEMYIEDSLKFKGFLVSDGIQQTFQAAPFEINLTATDGLMLLEGIPYIHNNLDGGRCIINYFRQILFSTNNLGLPLPIYWINSLKNTRYPLEVDLFSGSVNWAPRGEGFTDYNGTRKSCFYILESMLRATQSRIVQTNGRWEIWRINDMVGETLPRSYIGATLTGFEVTHETYTNVIRLIASKRDVTGYAFVDEDAILIVSPSLKTVTTTYKQDQRENILPNGNMDITSLGAPIYWGLIQPANGTISSAGSLYENGGNSIEVGTIPGASNILRLSAGDLPIDTDVLYTYLDFGFKFVVTQWAGVDAEGYIIWGDAAPFTVQVIYNANGVTYYLNEFGAWTTTSTAVPVEVPNLKVNDVTQLSFNKNGEITIPLPINPPANGVTPPSIGVFFNLKPALTMKLDDVYLKTDTNSDVYEATHSTSTNTGKEEYTLNISSAHSGFYVSNFMTSYAASALEKYFTDGKYTGTLTGMTSHAILRNRSKSSLIFQGSIYAPHYNYGELYNIKSLDAKKFLPLKSSWNTETNTINITLIETRDDGTDISMRHYGDNDKTALSN